jgi:hypothetical protein
MRLKMAKGRRKASGHDFSRAENGQERDSALAAAVYFLIENTSRRGYSIFGIAVDRKHTLKWLFP